MEAIVMWIVAVCAALYILTMMVSKTPVKVSYVSANKSKKQGASKDHQKPVYQQQIKKDKQVMVAVKQPNKHPVKQQQQIAKPHMGKPQSPQKTTNQNKNLGKKVAELKSKDPTLTTMDAIKKAKVMLGM